MEEWSADGFGGGSSEERLMNAVRAQDLRFSNFFITISTNVRPHSEDEEHALVIWMANVTDHLFNFWGMLNGTVLKPAGTRNGDKIQFENDHLIEAINSRVSIEIADVNDKDAGQVHAHVLLEVAHRYALPGRRNEGYGTDRPDRKYRGVHVNVTALRDHLNSRIHAMNLPLNRHPQKIYVNSKLLTKGTDNSNKWLTLAYINKDVDKDFRDLRQLENQTADPGLSTVRQNMLNNNNAVDRRLDVTARPASPPGWRDGDIGMGGALTPPGSPNAPRFVNVNPAPPRMVNVNPVPRRAAPKVPSFVQTTSGANVGMKRVTRGVAPKRYK